ncbi:protein argonaute-2 isoform X2 [Trichogramma pretiosum]|uniref:protein argonaute-2 isoform X2 n=1 Tax=Trichogramma pretiosum TaxID=7493 RepID=UPI000C71B241|nr:protein argonaute-2 isoform X2 [Trichogramma pretiosum]
MDKQRGNSRKHRGGSAGGDPGRRENQGNGRGRGRGRDGGGDNRVQGQERNDSKPAKPQEQSGQPSQVFQGHSQPPSQSQASGQPLQGAWGRGPSQSQPQARGQPSQVSQKPAQPPSQSQASGQPLQGAWGRGPSQSQPQASGQPSQVSQKHAQSPSQSQASGQPLQGAWGRGTSLSQPQATSQTSQPAWGRGQSQPQQAIIETAKTPDLSCVQLEQQMEKTNISKSTSSGRPGREKPNMNLEGLMIPHRRNLNCAGSAGDKFTVRTNMYEIKFGERFPTIIYQYDVEIIPEKKKYLYRAAFLEAIKQMYASEKPLVVPFDGKKNAYASEKLKLENEYEVTVHDADNQPTSYKLKFKLTNEINVSWLKQVRVGCEITDDKLTGIQALNIIMNDAPIRRGVQKGRAFYTHDKKASYLGAGLELWLGLFQSAIIGWKPYLNIDIAHKGFFKQQNLLDLVTIICREYYNRNDDRYRPSRDDIDRCTDLAMGLRHVRVTLQIGDAKRSKQCIQTIAKETAYEYFFDHAGHQISVYDYFLNFKNYRIKNPDLPLVMLGKTSAVPLEVCHIEFGQTTDSTKLLEKTTSNMIKAAATGTVHRKAKIETAMNIIYNSNDDAMKQFGIQLDKEFAKVDARLLKAPILLYGNNRKAYPSRGVWKPEKFRVPGSLQAAKTKHWSIINADKWVKSNDLFDLAKAIKTEAGNRGITLSDPLQPFPQVEKMPDLQKWLIQLKRHDCKFVIIILPDKGQITYAHTKTSAEIDIGMLTQCLRSNTLRNKIISRRDAATMTNLLQKINAKINGTNHTISKTRALEGGVCMLVGADVTHPSPQNPNQPSIAAVVSSQDHVNHFVYNTEIRLQDGNQELISDLNAIMQKQLLAFRKNSGRWPEKIFFFRDGVSEGFFREVIQKEIPCIEQACKHLQKMTNNLDNAKKLCSPKLTFIVVQKRHHTRFFPSKPEESDDASRNCNVRAGTVVDTMITHPSHVDFYLLSHASIQGTSRPTKYRLLRDDNNMSEDDLEELTYHLCHMFTRCTRSVSYPAPTYYAHLAAFRAKHFHDAQSNKLNGKQINDWSKVQALVTLHPEIQSTPMFFV